MGDFDGDGGTELLARSPWGIGLLRLSSGSPVELAIAANGSRLQGWVLSTRDNQFTVMGDFDDDGASEVLVTSAWGLTILKYSAGVFASLGAAPNGTRLGAWLLNTADNMFGIARVSRTRPVRVEQLEQMLVEEETDFAAIAWLGQEALPVLKDLLRSEDTQLVSKATYIASLISGEIAGEMLTMGANDRRPEVRAAAAAGIRNLNSARAAQLLEVIRQDSDMTVRLKAVKSTTQVAAPEVLSALQQIAEQDPSPTVRRIARERVQRRA
jgi:hypothetical protein